ncbi:inorganic phosphate transporter [Frankia sp. Cas3]|uniref:inorganic phosphate transporter n=1 Tax=Frankia sp. Cas3 TaxID=3073926 RepID=UPI002AD29018|nr:inorganic phosphate transporter [Frankia sp. Cas3]
MENDLLLALVIVTALGFDFTNGFHDAGNAMATSIATGALRPRVAVGLSAVLNLVGAFLSLNVAATIASGLVQSDAITLTVVFAGLCGGVTWNLLTWFFGIPSSSSQALIGGVIGATLAAAGTSGVKWQGLVEKVIIPAIMSPPIAGGIALVGTFLIFLISRPVPTGPRDRGFRIGQVGSASMVSLSHGTNDAQKTMGIITLALITNGTLSADAQAPDWVIVSCALAISLGTYVGGWRVMRTLGKGLIEIEAPQGMGAESASAATILLSSYYGYSLSTTQVVTGAILGSGVAKRGAEVRWRVAGRMAVAWVFTLPAAGIVGAVSYGIAEGIGGDLGAALVFIALLAVVISFYLASRRNPVNPDNINDEWTGDGVPAEPATTSST